MKPESRFRKTINDKVRLAGIYRQSNTYGMSNGTPDDYYDGEAVDLWAEYKWNPTMPRNGIVVGNYSALQLRWMKRRWQAGANVIGIVGLPDKSVALQLNPHEWEHGTLLQANVSRQMVVDFIVNYCNYGEHVSTNASNRALTGITPVQRKRK